jgi:hypothetical protein
VTDPFAPESDAAQPAWRRWIENPKYMLVLAVVALAAGIWMSRNTSRNAAARAELPPPADCRRFPGACAKDLPGAPPVEVVALHAEVATADSAWRATLERERRSGVFPDKGLTAMRDALVATESSILDARSLVHEAEQLGDADARTRALESLTVAYENKRELLLRARRLLEEAI